MNPDGYIRIDTKIDQSGAKEGLTGLTAQLKGFGSMVAMTFATVAASAVTKFAGECVNLASDLAEVQNVVDVTFGGSADQINAFSKKADKAFGLSELTAKKFTSTLGAMVKSMGFTEKQAAEMGKTMTGLAGDMASFYNIDAQTAFDKLRSGLSGEIEPLKQLGINLSETTLSAYALSQGITKAYSAMSEAEKVTLRYQYIMQATKDAQGDFTRTSDSLANQSRILAMEFDKLKTSIGSALMPLANDFVQGLNSLVAGVNNLGKATDAAKALDQVAESAARTEAQARAAGDVALGYVDTLERLAKNGLTTADAQQEYADTVRQLNALVPSLNITIDKQTGLIEQSTTSLRANIAAWKENAMAQALQERYTATIKAYANAQAEVTENEIKLKAVREEQGAQTRQLSIMLQEMATSLGLTGVEAENFKSRLAASGTTNSEFSDSLRRAGVDSKYITDELWNLREALINNQGAEQDLTRDIVYGKSQMGKYSDQVKIAEDATKEMMGTSKGAAPVIQKQAATVQDLAKESDDLAKRTDVLKSAIDQQTESGSLSVKMVGDLIDAGYAAAIQTDKETGAVTLNREAYIRLTNAQYDAQLAKLTLARTDLASAMDAERASIQGLTSDTDDAAVSMLRLLAVQQNDITKFDAQIAVIKAAKSEIGKYTASVSSGGGKVATAAEVASEKFKKAVEKIDRALELGAISQADYWKQYVELMKEYLQEGTDEWDDAMFDLQKGQKDIADNLAKETKAANEKAYEEAVDTVQGIKEAYDDQVRSIQQSIDNLTQQIAGINLVDELRDKNGNTTLEFLDVEELKAGNEQIATLQDNIQKLKNAGVSDSLLAQISKLGTAEANAYAQYLLTMDTDGFKAYMAEWEKRQEAAKAAAQLFFQDELDTLKTEYADKLTTALQDLNTQGSTLGQGVAKGIADGILSGKTAIADAVKGVLQAALTTQTPVISTPSVPPSVPHLAAGAVIPPNRKFLAVLGDQRRGTNIEAPLNTMLEAFRSALAESGGQGGGNIGVEFRGQLAPLIRLLQPMITVENNRRGPRAVKGVT